MESEQTLQSYELVSFPPDLLERYRQIDTVADQLALRGILLPEGYRRRDEREPLRTEKEAMEDRLFADFKKYFRFQTKKLRDLLARLLNQLGTGNTDLIVQEIEKEIRDDDIEGSITSLIVAAVLGGAGIFMEQQEGGLQIEWTNAQAEAAAWAVEHAGEMIKNIDETTLNAVREAVQAFIDTPGMTIRDVMDMIPLDDRRSRLIAVSEITDAYSEGELQMGKALAEAFPGQEVIKQWFTNRGPSVCRICKSMDGDVVGIFEKFIDIDKNEHDRPKAHPGGFCWLSVRVL